MKESSAWALAASGPSLTREQVDKCKEAGMQIATVNLSFRLIPDCDLFHACDSDFWDEYGNEAMGTLSPECIVYTGCPRAAEKHWIRLMSYGANPKTKWHCTSGALSGHQLIELVSMLGATEIILLGYDGHTKTKAHHHPDYPPHMVNARNISQHNPEYAKIRTNATITNCTEGSAITAFPQMALEDYLMNCKGKKKGKGK